MAWIFPDQVPAQKHPGALFGTLGCFSEGPSPEPHVFPIAQALTAVVLIRVVLTVVLPITLRVLFADAESTATLVGVIPAGHCALAHCATMEEQGLAPLLDSSYHLRLFCPAPGHFHPVQTHTRGCPAPRNFIRGCIWWQPLHSPPSPVLQLPSSLPSPQSSLPSHFRVLGTHFPLLHLKLSSAQPGDTEQLLRAGWESCSSSVHGYAQLPLPETSKAPAAPTSCISHLFKLLWYSALSIPTPLLILLSSELSFRAQGSCTR